MRIYNLNSIAESVNSGQITRNDGIRQLAAFVLYNKPLFGLHKYDEDFVSNLIVAMLEKGESFFDFYDEKQGSFFNYFFSYVKNLIHSEKRRLAYPDSSNELIILLEADLLDEEGALGIAWDLMALGSMEHATYYDTMDAIKHSKHILEQDFMVTKKAREIWNKKKMLVKLFDDEIASDLFLEDEDGLF